MRGRVVSIMLGLAAIAGGCTTTGTPATAPPTTTVQSTPTSPTSTSTSTLPTTTTIVTTTTLDRNTEVQAIFDDLERRWNRAIKDQDREAFDALFANGAYRDENSPAFELVTVLDPGGFDTLSVQVLAESDNCLAARIKRDYSRSILGGGISERTFVAELTNSGWGLSWIGEGWICDGPHPFSR